MVVVVVQKNDRSMHERERKRERVKVRLVMLLLISHHCVVVEKKMEITRPFCSASQPA